MYFNKVKNKMSLKVEIETYNEVKLWREMNDALKLIILTIVVKSFTHIIWINGMKNIAR